MNQKLYLPFPKKGDLETTKNYKAITFTALAVKVYKYTASQSDLISSWKNS